MPLLGALAAVAVSGGLVWWFGPAQRENAPAAPVAAAPPARSPPARAPPQADRAQVQRAFDEVQDAFADGGAEGLARADAGCAAALKADGRVLDYCLAFDLFATAVAPEIARKGDPDAALLAQASAALPPGVDPAARLATVRSLMREATLGGGAPRPEPTPRPQRVRVVAPPSAHRGPTEREARRQVAAHAMQAGFAWRPADPCFGPTMAERLACSRAQRAHSQTVARAGRGPDPVARLLAEEAISEEAPH